MEKQKQFVTNAGHEIKTPLAIIQSNTEAMELYNGENKWSRNIKEQTVRLSGLMQNLLLLARMDEGASQVQAADFSLSDMLTAALESFAQPMEAKHKLTLLMGQHKGRGDVIVGGKVQKAGENIGIQLWVGDPETDRGVKDQRTGELRLDRADAVQLPAVRQTFYLRVYLLTAVAHVDQLLQIAGIGLEKPPQGGFPEDILQVVTDRWVEHCQLLGVVGHEGPVVGFPGCRPPSAPGRRS